jgi:hypothetical protein
VTAYSFVTRWHAEARIETVFATIADADAWRSGGAACERPR